ncbi:AAA family ATPase [Novosphingobium sp. PASSN1]|uniref:AAA family ATPase n=1 Tax=Novosphingobium sp. PASSN1 TaxID=2015561 RepID=UPI0025DDE58C|nr:AAA family ATPase [Novosphingobium sp. PASSN1]
MSAYPTANEVVPREPIANSEFFLDHVRRGAGVLCTSDEAGKWRQYPFAEPSEALTLVERFKDERDIYVTMGTLREGATKRIAENIVSLCGFFVDLDCHGKDGEYANINVASDALRSFCKSAALPKPDYIVSSGHGLHAHWTFHDAIPRDIWQEIANELKTLMLAHGLKADHQVTADPARVLRVPCTYNFRDRAEPTEVELLPIPSLAEPTTLSEFRCSLRQALGKSAIACRGSSNRPQSPLMALIKNEQRALADTPGNIEVVRRMLDCLSPDSDYPVWRDALWGVAATGFASARSIALDWSQRGDKWELQRFETVWNSFTPDRNGSIGFGTLAKLARDAGYVGSFPTTTSAAALPAQSRAPSQFRLLDRSAIMAQPPLRWRVKWLFPETGIGAVYGPSGSGKSFLGFDLGMSIAAGSKWFGYRTTACAVTYVILEAESGLRNRVQAWEAHNGTVVPSGFKAIAQPFQLAEAEQVEELGAILPQGGVVIIDTLNRAAPGLDENSSQDMGRILAGMKRLQEITGGLVLVVHHTGKDASKGLRGHSSLFAALDGAIEVERSANGRRWSAAKVKDGEDGTAITFALHVVDLGNDADGDPITSCAAGPDTGAIFRPNPPGGKHQKEALAAIRHALSTSVAFGQGGADPQTACLRIDDAVTQASTAMVGVEKKRRSSRAREAVQGLISGGHLQRGLDASQDEWVWL